MSEPPTTRSEGRVSVPGEGRVNVPSPFYLAVSSLFISIHLRIIFAVIVKFPIIRAIPFKRIAILFIR